MKKKTKTLERQQLEKIYKLEKKLVLQNIRRAQKSKFPIPTKDVAYAKAHMPAVNTLTDAQLKLALKMVQKIHQSPIYSTKGQKAIAKTKQKTLARHGVKVSLDEMQEYGKFMDDLREWGINRMFDSGKASELWDEMRQQNSSRKEIEKSYKEWHRARYGRRRSKKR